MNRPPFSGIEVFLTIVREGSLRAAAKALGVGAPAISHQLKELESKLGVDLLVRTTRSIELTDAGRTLLSGAGPAFQEVLNAIEDTRDIGQSKTGTLRLTLARASYNVVLSPVLAEFQQTYPDVRLELSMNEGLVDIIKEGFHAGIRVGDRLTPDMVATRVSGPLTPAFSAAPSYLDVYGRPQHPRELLDHKCIRYKFITANKIADWHFVDDGQTKIIDPPSNLIFDSFEMVNQASREGHGIGWSLRAAIEHDLTTGTLETVLDDYITELPPFYVFYPVQHRRLELLRLFVDFLLEKRDCL